MEKNESKKVVETPVVKPESKRQKWTMLNGVITCHFPNDVKTFSCALIDLYPNWAKYDDAQLMVIFYGIKQCLSDGVSNKKELALTNDEIRENYTRKWKRWTVERKFHSGERANAVSPKVSVSAITAKAADEKLQKEFGLSPEQMAALTAKLLQK